MHCEDPGLVALLQNCHWKTLFWENRDKVRASMRILVVGHAVLEQALEPRPGITCKAIVVPAAADPDAAALGWLERRAPGDSPRILSPLPIFGYPGWHPGGERAEFYDDARYFRPPAVKSQSESARQPLRAKRRGKSGLRRAGCRVTPWHGDVTNRATETSP